jgi:hypothetical protein
MNPRYQRFFLMVAALSFFLLSSPFSNNAAYAQTVDTNVIFEQSFESPIVPVDIQFFTLNGEVEPAAPIGTSATLLWDTTNANSCSASSLPGDSVGGWNAAIEIGIAGAQEISFSADGIYELNLECLGDGNTTDTASITVQVGPTSITQFTVTPESADLGTDQTFTLKWESGNSPDGCQGSWPAGVDLPSSGTVDVNVTDVQPGLEFTLTCASPFDQDQATVPVTVTDPSVCDVTLTNSYFRSWAISFGAAFPGPNFTRIGFAYVPADGFTAYTFNTGDAEDGGYVATFQANGTGGSRKISFSEVPGCFDVEPNCVASGRDSDLEWDTTGTSSTACQLKKQTTYYWNITFTDGADPDSSSCPNDCYAGLVINNPDYGE